jgi:putative colanic acid biosynthesis UDP-glucose lipid carrier transferase
MALACLRVALPPTVVVGLLYLLTYLYGEAFGDPFIVAAAVAFGLSAVLLQPPRDLATQLFSQRIPIVFGIVSRWALIFAILVTAGYATRHSGYFARRVMLSWAVLSPVVLVVATLLLNELRRRILKDPANARRVIFAGYNELSFSLADRLAKYPESSMKVVGFFDDRSPDRLILNDRVELLGTLTELVAYVKDNATDVIFIALPIRHIQRVVNLLAELHDTTASIYYVPDVYAFDLIQARTGEILGIPVVAMCETPFSGHRAAIKRLTDLVLAIAMVAVISPLLILISVLVKTTSPGPVIFKQRRYGLDGREIFVYKFRTMTVTEDGTTVQQASRNDQRVTRIGAVLRRYSLDEVPQLLNVLQGTMSLVGPRPHAVAHNEQYRKLIKGYMLRHKVLPGITGLAQVNGCRGETSRVEDMQTRVKYDLEYLRHWSILLDIKILLLTALKVFRDDRAF